MYCAGNMSGLLRMKAMHVEIYWSISIIDTYFEDGPYTESNRKHKSINKWINHDLVFIEVLPLKLHESVINHESSLYSIKGITFMSRL